MQLDFLHGRSVVILRIFLGIVFFWFGMLKLFNASQAQGLIADAVPLIGDSQFLLFLLAFIEMLIGAAFIMNKYVRLAAIVLLIESLCVGFAVLFTHGFAPRFPLLSFAGEYALLQLVVAGTAFILLAEAKNNVPHHHTSDGKDEK